MWIARSQQSVYLVLGEDELRQQNGRYECKMSNVTGLLLASLVAIFT